MVNPCLATLMGAGMGVCWVMYLAEKWSDLFSKCVHGDGCCLSPHWAQAPCSCSARAFSKHWCSLGTSRPAGRDTLSREMGSLQLAMVETTKIQTACAGPQALHTPLTLFLVPSGQNSGEWFPVNQRDFAGFLWSAHSCPLPAPTSMEVPVQDKQWQTSP